MYNNFWLNNMTRAGDIRTRKLINWNLKILTIVYNCFFRKSWAVQSTI